LRTVFRVILIINHRAGRGAAAARGGGAARRRAGRSGAARPSVLTRSLAVDAAQWSRRPRLTGLPSIRRCSGRGRGGDLLFLAEREQAPPCPVCEAGRWSCHLGFTTSTPQPSPARDTFPSAGLSWSRVCAAKAGPLGDSADGTRLEGRGSAARLALVAEASHSTSRERLYPQLYR
jgi:hypothetical protein